MSNSNYAAERALAHAQDGVDRFGREIIDLPVPDKPTVLGKERRQFAVVSFTEEIKEFVYASRAGDVVEAADALVDLVYFALGRLTEMGVPFRPVFDAVQEANMQKERGEQAKRPGSLGHDAVKPDGWEPPDHSWLLEITTLDIRRVQLLNKHNVPERPLTAEDNWRGISVSSADKYDDGKVPLSLVPREALELEAAVFEHGRKKYSAWNWTKGLPYSRYIDAAMRHLIAFADGEDLDSESGLGHLGHLRCCAAMLIGTQRLHPELDDRRKNL